MITWATVRREPFRVLFPLGTLFGLLGVSHWLVYALGWSGSYSGAFHAFLQVSSYMFCFIAGFLLTAVPRFASAAPASNGELLAILVLLAAQSAAATLGAWVMAESCFAGLLIVLIVFAARRFGTKHSSAGPPTEFVWIPMALLHGLIGTTLLILGQLGWLPPVALAIGRPMAQQGFLLGIVVGVGGFMAPRLMGRAARLVAPAGVDAIAAARIRARRVLLHGLAGVVLLASFMVEGFGSIRFAYTIRAVMVTAELAWTSQFYLRPATADRYVQLVWVSLWMIVIGLWGIAIAPRYRVAMLHVVLIGGTSLIAFAVGTMVVLSHTGEGMRLKRPLWVLRVVGIGLTGALMARVSAEFVPSRFFALLGAASVCWMAAAGSWLWFTLPRVMRSTDPGEFDRLHEEAKRRILKTAEPC